MKKEAIREYMLRKIAESFESAITEAEERITDEIDEGDICEYIWNKDFGIDIYDDYIDTIIEDLKEEILEEIYEDIDVTDILDVTGRK